MRCYTREEQPRDMLRVSAAALSALERMIAAVLDCRAHARPTNPGSPAMTGAFWPYAYRWPPLPRSWSQ